MDAVWIGLVLLPVGFWLRRSPASLGALTLVVSGAVIGPAAGWIGLPDPATVAGFAGGILMGWTLSQIARRTLPH